MQPADVRLLLRDALAGAIVLPELGSVIDASKAKAAAVVVPVAARPEPSAILILRSSQLADHPGEVAFPGGKPEPSDPDLASTALRELEEEVGVPRGDVEILGTLRPVPVITGRYLIHPFVGVLSERASPCARTNEIARVIELPVLPLVRGERPIHVVRDDWNGAPVFAPHFRLDGCVLYGASAYILYELLGRIARVLGVTMPAPTEEAEPPWGKRYSA